MDAMRQRFYDMQLPVTWDVLETPTPSKVTPPAEEVEKADTSINIKEREDFWDLWIQFDDDNKPLPLPTVADKYHLPDSLFGICFCFLGWCFSFSLGSFVDIFVQYFLE